MGRMHKKKIAEYISAENERTENKSPNDDENEKKRATSVKSRSSDINGTLDELEVFEENGGAKVAKKRKVGENISDNADDEVAVPKKARKGTGKSKAKTKKAAAKASKEGDADEDEQEYEVAAIVDHKVEKGTSYYLVRWKGYTKDDDTWEPEDTLSCNELIEKFNKKYGPAAGKASKTAGKPAGKGQKKSPHAKEEGVKEYDVDKIINYAEEETGRVFLIRWKGYTAKHDTWEPEENLHCDEMIKKFMERMEKQANANFKELREDPKRTKRLLNEVAPRSHYKSTSGRSSKRAAKKRD